MMDLQNIATLNTLIATTIDSANGFEEAAKNARATGLAQQFAELSRDRWAVVETLEAEVRRLGSEPKRSGTAKAAVHRRWLDLKNSVAGSDAAVLKEVENGETYLVGKYEAVLRQQDLAVMTRGAIEDAYSTIRRTEDQVASLAALVGSSDNTGGSGVNWGRIGVAVALGGAAFAATRYARSRRSPTPVRPRRGVTVAIDRTSTAEIESRNREGDGTAKLAARASEMNRDIDNAPTSTKRSGARRGGRSDGAATTSLAAGGSMGGEAAGFQTAGSTPDLSSGSGTFGSTGNSDDFKS